MADKNTAPKGRASLDFHCVEDGCGELVKFDLEQCSLDNMQILCPKCHTPYVFDKALREKFDKLYGLIAAVREAESILGDCSVAVAVPGGEVKIPYALLLTRLNTMITLELGSRKVDFHLWIEPASAETFR